MQLETGHNALLNLGLGLVISLAGWLLLVGIESELGGHLRVLDELV